MASSNYEVGRLGQRCAATGAELRPGDVFVAALCESEDTHGVQQAAGPALVRHDYTVAAWEAGPALPGNARLFAFWRGVVPEPNQPSRPAIDAAALMDLFDQLGDSTDARRLALRHFLALILVRKRALVIVSQREGVTMVRPRVMGEGEAGLIEVVDPPLDGEALAQVTRELAAALGLDE